VDYPFVIETRTGGYRVTSEADLHRLAREHTKLSPGYIASATPQEILRVLVKALDGITSPP